MLLRQVYDEIYYKLLLIQRSYLVVQRELIRTSASSNPSNDQEIKVVQQLEQQIQLAGNHIEKLEEIKYYCSITLLTEGSLIKEKELSNAIDYVKELIDVAEYEKTTEDKYIKYWAEQKLSNLTEVDKILLKILNHKLKRKQDFGEVSLH